jgi:hypothetical protein
LASFLSNAKAERAQKRKACELYDLRLGPPLRLCDQLASRHAASPVWVSDFSVAAVAALGFVTVYPWLKMNNESVAATRLFLQIILGSRLNFWARSLPAV